MKNQTSRKLCLLPAVRRSVFAVQAAGILEAVVSVRVVSIPGKELFTQQAASVQNKLFRRPRALFVVEAARVWGWGDLFPPTAFLFLGSSVSALPLLANVLAEKFGFNRQDRRCACKRMAAEVMELQILF